MLKMYHNQDHAGSTADFWEETWEGGGFEETVKFCAIDPLRPLFEKYLRPGSRMLEGGCGQGNYVAYYTARGFRVVGLDFAQRALKTLRARQPQLTLCGGDVSQLPFADNTFDLYYSGGVVEHFEDGADAPLLEARRVLKDDGTLLISVPYYSPLRRALSAFHSDEWRKVAGPATDEKQFAQDKTFFQYAYHPREFQQMLADVGLKVVEKQGYAVLWGLRELPLLNRNGISEFSPPPAVKPTTAAGAVEVDKLVKERPRSILKRLIVSEDDTIPILGLGVKMTRWSAANMMMFVCVRK